MSFDQQDATPVQGSQPSVVATSPVIRPSWDPTSGSWVVSPDRTRPPARDRADRSWVKAAIAGAVAGAIVATVVAFPLARMTASRSTVVEQRVTGLPALRGAGSSIPAIAARARPWVVNINITGNQTTAFGSVPVSGTGSGVIIRPDGYILTNAHVVQDASAIEVTIASGENLSAKVVASDPETDIAVVKVSRSDLPAAVIGSVKNIVVGETAVAIGSPLGLEQTVTAGIISALGRVVPRQGESPLVDMVQTDAPITQGNSGGALIDAQGSVIGINAAIATSPEVGAEGVAFAIPIDIAVAVANELIETGRATHPWLGVAGANIDPQTAKQFGVTQGAFIHSVVKGGPADTAGIRADDIVISLGGETIKSMADLVVATRHHKVGESVAVVVVRSGKRLTRNVRIGNKPANQ